MRVTPPWSGETTTHSSGLIFGSSLKCLARIGTPIKLKTPIAIIDKRRPRPNVAEVMNIVGEIEGRTAIIIDRRLSIIAIGVFKMSANLRARVTPPWSGETTTHS
jgi:hypothetical protein